MHSETNNPLDCTQEVMESTYASPNDVPGHSRLRNFEIGGIDRIAMLRGEWKCSRLEHARRLVDLVVSRYFTQRNMSCLRSAASNSLGRKKKLVRCKLSPHCLGFRV